jgi:YHS domain-containing protein
MRSKVLGPALAVCCVLVGTWGTGVAGAQSACTDLGGTVDPVQQCYVHAEESAYKYDFSFPVNYPDQQAVADYLTHERDEFVDYVKTLKPRADIPYELEAKGQTYFSGSPDTGTASTSP